ncbi:MAG: phosphatidylinositol-specific phospholipase C/glycerophosphodiester phosphodiesterase family protein [Pirellulales bacterium]
MIVVTRRLALRGITAAALFVGLGLFAAAAESPVFVRAHAHNDYWHERPLVDALELGFASIEADVFLVDGKLLVGHDPLELRPERTLEALYLAPLRERAARNGGSVHGDGTRLMLFVDFKSSGPATYDALDSLLQKYSQLVSSCVDGRYQPRAVDVVISGDRPVEKLASASSRYAAIDGRLSELAPDPPQTLIPVVSESWPDHFQWDGEGAMPDAERATLKEIVQRVHGQGRRLRFWATPETEACWRELMSADVDLIGTDDLKRLANFLKGSDTDRVPKDSAHP